VGTNGYQRAADVAYTPDSVILEFGVERDSDGNGSTTFLSRVGPRVHVVDIDFGQVARARQLSNVTAYFGPAEEILVGWDIPIGFAWLDGHDWPYEHAPVGMWDAQEREYLARGQAYSREASRASHLAVAQLIEAHVIPGGVVILDDTWELPSVLDPTPGPGWNGKGGTAVPFLLTRGFTVEESGDIYHGFVALRKE
jgi:hypothetical protein